MTELSASDKIEPHEGGKRPMTYNPVAHGHETHDPENPLVAMEPVKWLSPEGKHLTFNSREIAKLDPGAFFIYEEPIITGATAPSQVLEKQGLSTILSFKFLGLLRQENAVTPLVERVSPQTLADITSANPELKIVKVSAAEIPGAKPR